MSEGPHRADILYTEADGVWIHLQREDRTHYEVKSGVAYRGWRCVGDNRYELVGKRVYGHASESIPFWEGASLEWPKQYALDRVKLLVMAGDGANWIHRGTEEFGNAVFQLDGFHLSRACGRGYGTEIGPAIYDCDTIRLGVVRQRIDVCDCDRRDRNGQPGQGVRRIQHIPRSGLAKPCPQRSVGRSESGDDAVQRRQAHSESDEETWYQLADTGSQPNGQDDPAKSERRVGEVLSQAVGPRPGSWKAMSAPTRRIYEQNSGQRLGRRFSTRVERTPQLPTVGD